jgi:hypothetical protein
LDRLVGFGFVRGWFIVGVDPHESGRVRYVVLRMPSLGRVLLSPALDGFCGWMADG